jgi:hypothetical protein
MTNIKPMVMVTVDEQKDRMSHPSNPVVTAMARNRPGLWLSRIWAWHRWHFMASGVVYRPNNSDQKQFCSVRQEHYGPQICGFRTA